MLASGQRPLLMSRGTERRREEGLGGILDECELKGPVDGWQKRLLVR